MIKIMFGMAGFCLAFMAGNMLAHMNEALPITIVAALTCFIASHTIKQ